METGTILKQFRIQRNMTQDELCQGIISRQTYSRIENNLCEPNLDILKHLLEKLNYQITDFWREMTKGETLEECYKYFLKGIAGQLSAQEARQLMNLLPDITEINNRYLHFSGMLKSHLHSQFPEIIPTFSDFERNNLKNYILQLKHFSVYDLRIIGDFASRLLDYQQLKQLFFLLPDLRPYDYGEESSIYRTQVHKIYNNFCDVALEKNDFPFVKILLKKHRKFANVHSDLRYLTYLKINEIILEYKMTKNRHTILQLTNIAENLTFIGDKKTANAVLNQMNSYLEDNYKPENHIVIDK